MPEKVVLRKSGPSPALQSSKSFKIRPPALHVQEHSGDFAQWVKTKTVDAPEESLFSFRNDNADVTEATWQLSTVPMSPKNPSPNFRGFLGSGSLQPPPQGEARTFTANWKALVPAKPTNGTSYYLRVVVAGPRKSPVVASNMVEIIVNKSTSPGVKFTSEGLGLTVQQQHPDLYATPSMTVQLDLDELYIGNDNEAEDEPYLFVAVVYVDGTTIDPLQLQTSTARIDSAKKTHGNVPDEDADGEDLEETSTAQIPSSTGHFEETITPIGLQLAAALDDPDGSLGDAIRDTTAVYLVIGALEEDDTSTEGMDAARAAFVKALQSEVDAVIQSSTVGDDGNLPKFGAKKLKEMNDRIREKALCAAEDEAKDPLWWTPALFPFLLDEVDADDVVGFAVRKFSYGDLLAAGPAGIHFEATASADKLEDWEGSYTIRGKIRGN